MIFDCYFGPDLGPFEYREIPLRGGVLRAPAFSAGHVQRIATTLRAEAAQLRRIPVNELIAGISRATRDLVNPAGEIGAMARSLLPASSGYSAEMIDQLLARMADDWSADALARLVTSEFGSASVLDGTDARTFALGADLTAHIFSGNVPGVAVTSLMRALLVKSPSFGKAAHSEPVLPVLFARALQRVDARIARAVAVTYWPGGEAPLDQALVDEADTVVVYGGADAVSGIRGRLNEAARLVVHGPKVSFGVVHNRASADARVAAGAARAVAMFDQQGCVSPHTIFVVGSTDQARTFARTLAEQLSALDRKLPRGSLTTEEAVALRRKKAEAEFGGMAGAHVELVSNVDSVSTVVLADTAVFQPSCLNRFVYVQPVATHAVLIDALRPHRQRLQSDALAGFDKNEATELVLLLGGVGVSRITTFEKMPWPPVDWHHDGSAPLRELVRFVDLEL